MNLEDLKNIEFNYSTTRRLLSLPQAMWVKEIVPVLKKCKVEIPNEFNPVHTVDYKSFVWGLSYSGLQKVLFMCIHASPEIFRMKALKYLLKKFGFRIIKEQGAYIFESVEESSSKDFLDYYISSEQYKEESNNTEPVVNSTEPVNTEPIIEPEIYVPEVKEVEVVQSISVENDNTKS